MTVHNEICTFITDFHKTHGFAPTVREIAAGVNRSVSTTHFHLYTLWNQGKVTWEPGSSRTIRVVK